MPTLTADTHDFDQKVIDRSADRVVIVDFWADWCRSCTAMSPLFDQLADAHPDVDIVKVEAAEHNRDLVARFALSSLPSVKVFSGGEIVHQFTGPRPKPLLEKELSAYLG